MFLMKFDGTRIIKRPPTTTQNNNNNRLWMKSTGDLLHWNIESARGSLTISDTIIHGVDKYCFLDCLIFFIVFSLFLHFYVIHLHFAKFVFFDNFDKAFASNVAEYNDPSDTWVVVFLSRYHLVLNNVDTVSCWTKEQSGPGGFH